MVLAAGLGTRLRPLTELRPKPLCPVGPRPLIDRCLDLLAPHCGDGSNHLAVNAFHLAEQVVAHLGDRAQVSVETELLGTAGGLAKLAAWRAGRDVLLLNGDAYLAAAGTGSANDSANHSVLAALLDGWGGRTVRMLVVPAPEAADFTDDAGDWRYVGACLMPDDLLRDLPVRPGGLHSLVWTPARQAGRLELVPFDGVAIDTGTPAGYLAANLHSSGGVSVVGAGAEVLGSLEESVVWPGAVVAQGESLHRAIRAGDRDTPVTVTVAP